MNIDMGEVLELTKGVLQEERAGLSESLTDMQKNAGDYPERHREAYNEAMRDAAKFVLSHND